MNLLKQLGTTQFGRSAGEVGDVGPDGLDNASRFKVQNARNPISWLRFLVKAAEL